ncbi:protein of unknown function [Thiomonas sp. OC7]|nr:protein of unknown function [Thiomonas sp. OC7]
MAQAGDRAACQSWSLTCLNGGIAACAKFRFYMLLNLLPCQAATPLPRRLRLQIPPAGV